MEQKFKQGDRVRLTRDLPDDTPVHPVHLYKGDLGTVCQHPRLLTQLGFQSDRWEDITSFFRVVDGDAHCVLDFCELVEAAAPALEISAFPSIAPESDFGWCQRCNKFRLLFSGTCGDCLAVEQEADDCCICGSDADTTIPVCKECKEDLVAHMPEVDYKGIEAQLSKLQPVRYEIKTLLQDISEDAEADNSLAQLLNEGWEILELTHLSVYIGPGYESELAFRRVVTLRRAISIEEWAAKELAKVQPYLGTLSEMIGTVKEILGTDGDDGK